MPAPRPRHVRAMPAPRPRHARAMPAPCRRPCPVIPDLIIQDDAWEEMCNRGVRTNAKSGARRPCHQPVDPCGRVRYVPGRVQTSPTPKILGNWHPAPRHKGNSGTQQRGAGQQR
eukprot:gene19472-biopygen4016